MMRGQFYSNDNGRVTSGSFDGENFNIERNDSNSSAEEILSKFNNKFMKGLTFGDGLEDAFFGTGNIINRMIGSTPRPDKGFPKKNKYLDPDTKVLYLTVGAIGVKEDEFRADVDGDHIVIQFNHKPVEKEAMLYDFKGLKMISDERVVFDYDPRFHDISTAECTLENGLLTISIQPREEIKPVKKQLGGSLILEEKKESSDEASATDENTTDSE